MHPTQTIPFMSDIGASYLKPLFVTNCFLTGIFRTLIFAAGSYLRHQNRIPTSGRLLEKIAGGLTVISSVIGGVTLILLGVYDTHCYKNFHQSIMWMFMATSISSAVCSCWEFWIIRTCESSLQHIYFHIEATC